MVTQISGAVITVNEIETRTNTLMIPGRWRGVGATKAGREILNWQHLSHDSAKQAVAACQHLQAACAEADLLLQV